MTDTGLNELIARAENLPPEDQLQLISRLVEKVRTSYRRAPQRKKWRELCGRAPNLLDGEDAQTWVNRTRRASDESRGK